MMFRLLKYAVITFLFIWALAIFARVPTSGAQGIIPPVCLSDDTTDAQWDANHCDDYDYPEDGPDTQDIGDDDTNVVSDGSSETPTTVETVRTVLVPIVVIQPGTRVRVVKHVRYRHHDMFGVHGVVITRLMKGDRRDRDWLTVRSGARVIRVQRFAVKS